ncbi:uncharacterized protein SPPG_03435 [Spizellomyces punctatus DAOM BR117]|uniref:Uncharacterized protein n=1 Tax=Spizellomyces punctatus (strain DAOM BR117) TaxID=645134 RepID=A0A0L0HL75_SPIPD|nr:uncharacterized protein SPPG_03435 [Spizellomyces punctatus DAOM BR117]KND01640.1 hypothetical protein SPPG_03435 [Spizellomyces punctatus DAOM BR117]|eukprot:XP_016609679.1 hypothetical protein SPPG_03435 [Spizellomyces punctatus DAOM BR117]
MDRDAKLALLLSIFDDRSERNLLDALDFAQGRVEQAVEILLGNAEGHVSGGTNKRKHGATIDEFFGGSERGGKKMHLDRHVDVSDDASQPGTTTTSSPGSRNAFEVLCSGSLHAEDAKGVSLPPRTLTAKEVAEHIPCQLVLDVLPEELAASLLQKLMVEAESWKIKRFVMFDREVESPHTTSFYTDEPYTSSSSTPDVEYYYGGKKTTDVRTMFPELAQARSLIAERVNRALDERDHVQGGRHPAELVGIWEPNIVLANCYRGAAEGVGAHNDKMTYIGPRPTIGSLTLGATRPFRVRRIRRPGGPVPQTFNIMLPHNSLLIMLPPMQEEYKHEVPKCNPKLLIQHPISKDTRINLTFRVARPEYRDNIPVCRCGNPTELRVVIKKESNLGRYFYMCAGGGNETSGIESGSNCGFFEWLDLKGKS